MKTKNLRHSIPAICVLAFLSTVHAQTFKAGTTTTGAPGTAAKLSIKKSGKTVKFNFTVPQGPAGLQGIQGIQGIAGASPFTLTSTSPNYTAYFGLPEGIAEVTIYGNLKLGSFGDFPASAGVENLNILRGEINANGTIAQGSGFTVTHTLTGNYVINFPNVGINDSPVFSGTPTIVATAKPASGIIAVALINSVSSTSANVYIYSFNSNMYSDQPFDFIVTGPR